MHVHVALINWILDLIYSQTSCMIRTHKHTFCIWSRNSPESLICARVTGRPGHHRIDNGDSGGPVVVRTSTGFELIAVQIGRKNLPKEPYPIYAQIYNSVSHFCDWIKQQWIPLDSTKSHTNKPHGENDIVVFSGKANSISENFSLAPTSERKSYVRICGRGSFFIQEDTQLH